MRITIRKIKGLHFAWMISCLIVTSSLLVPVAYARTQVTPEITISESFVKNKTSTQDETGQVTKISPGIVLNYNQARLDLSLAYRINAVINSGLQGEDHENQSLNFLTQITHLPNHWTSQFNAQVKQINTSPDGIQIINEINNSSNSKELRTIGFSTRYLNSLSRDVDYLTGFSINYADLENQDDTDSLVFNLGVNNNRAQSKLSWNANITSRKTSEHGSNSQNDDHIDTLQAGLSYRINRKLSTYLAADKSETSNENLNETNTTLGVFWVPNANSSIRIGTGKRGDDTTWSLDSVIKNRKLSLQVNYKERVTTSRQLIFEETELQPGQVSTSQPLSITPVLLKKGTISLTANGRVTDFTLAYFNQSENLENSNSEEVLTKGLSMSVKRRLSRLSFIQLSLSEQESQTTQENTIQDLDLSYNRQLSKQLRWSVEIRNTKQSSDVLENRYEQSLLGFSLSATF